MFGKDQSDERCFFKKVKLVSNPPEKKGRRKLRYVIDETVARYEPCVSWSTRARMAEEQLWLIRYFSVSDEAPEGANMRRGHAVFRARDEEQARWRLNAWLCWGLREQAWIESVELLPASSLKALPVR